MRQIICLVLLGLSVLLSACQKNGTDQVDSSNDQNSTAIIDGSTATANEFPFLVNIWMNDSTFNAHLCGGSLISSKWVLTAAHCITEDASESTIRTVSPKKLTLIFQSLSINGTGGRKVKAKSVIAHPQFSWPNHDIALIELAEAVTDIQPINLYQKDQGSILNPASAIVMGWGLTDQAGRTDGQVLLKTTLPLVDRQYCSDDEFPKRHGWKISDDTICAKTNLNKNASCHGDSGGPLVQILSGQFYQIGVVSWGSACGGNRTVSHSDVEGYASIYDAYNWIQNTAR